MKARGSIKLPRTPAEKFERRSQLYPAGTVFAKDGRPIYPASERPPPLPADADELTRLLHEFDSATSIATADARRGQAMSGPDLKKVVAALVRARRKGDDKEAARLMDQLRDFDFKATYNVRRGVHNRGAPRGARFDDSAALKLMARIESETGIRSKEGLAREALRRAPKIAKGNSDLARIKRLAAAYGKSKK